EGNVALHWAAFTGSLEVAEALLQKMNGRDLDVVNLHRDTPLHVACRQGKWNVAGLLLERGADGQLENESDPPETPESLAVALRAPKLILDKLSWSKKRVSNRINLIHAKLADDISRGHERIPIRVINEVDREWSPPDDFNYVSNIYESGESSHNIERRLDLMNACSCADDCSSSCLCCETDHRGGAYQNGRLTDDFEWGSACEVIVECSPACKCDANCQNRVVQKGMQIRVELFMSVNRGWAVRCLQRIPKGTYICEYAGEILTSDMADARDDDTYLFEIESDGHNHCIDAGKFGNISRFINHHCEPNLSPVKVLWDHADRRYPHICFFAKRDIPKGEELTFDYGDKFWEIKGRQFTCKCQASSCRYNDERIEEFLESREQLENELPSSEASE
uniref:Uncharacterized protein n=1 Tax=Plectus sambesii TaxID=2011161 RepID=A0A914XRT5_9BILA